MNPMSPNTARIIEGDDLLRETVERMLSEQCTTELVSKSENDPWPGELWNLFSEMDLLSVGTGRGGSIGSVLDAAEVLFACGRFSVPLPIAESGIIGGTLASIAGLELGADPITVPIPNSHDRIEISVSGGTWSVDAQWNSVPWASEARHLVTAVKIDDYSEVVLVVESPEVTQRRRNLAGEPRDEVVIADSTKVSMVVPVPPGTVKQMHRLGALSRSLLIAGALNRCVQMAVSYSQERHQFGKPISSFQAIQHHLAIASEHAAAGALAAWVAVAAMVDDQADPFGKVAMSKVVAQESVEVVTARTHQVFGAIGMTREHELHLKTRRCWAWSHEWGSATLWADEITGALLDAGASNLWESITGGGSH